MSCLYSNREFADMVFMYGFAKSDAELAHRLYAKKYPKRHAPPPEMFLELERNLREFGSCVRPEDEESSGRTIRIRNRTIHVSEAVREESTRKIFSKWLLGKRASNPRFANSILFTDEAIFTKHGITNEWSEGNHRVVAGRDNRFFLNVWMGVLGDRILGPVFLPSRLTSAAYREFLAKMLPQMLEDVAINERLQMWFMHEGSAPHFANRVRKYLNRTFPERWIGQGGPVEWPAQTSDWNPVFFYLWVSIIPLVYSTPVKDVEELRKRVESAGERMRAKADFLETVRIDFVGKCQTCVDTVDEDN